MNYVSGSLHCVSCFALLACVGCKSRGFNSDVKSTGSQRPAVSSGYQLTKEDSEKFIELITKAITSAATEGSTSSDETQKTAIWVEGRLSVEDIQFNDSMGSGNAMFFVNKASLPENAAPLPVYMNYPEWMNLQAIIDSFKKNRPSELKGYDWYELSINVTCTESNKKCEVSTFQKGGAAGI